MKSKCLVFIFPVHVNNVFWLLGFFYDTQNIDTLKINTAKKILHLRSPSQRNNSCTSYS